MSAARRHHFAVAITGYARAALRELLADAAHRGAQTARASISPATVASLDLVRSVGFGHVGERSDQADGLEPAFERSLRAM